MSGRSVGWIAAQGGTENAELPGRALRMAGVGVVRADCCETRSDVSRLVRLGLYPPDRLTAGEAALLARRNLVIVPSVRSPGFPCRDVFQRFRCFIQVISNRCQR